jgi:hypothetical protein
MEHEVQAEIASILRGSLVRYVAQIVVSLGGAGFIVAMAVANHAVIAGAALGAVGLAFAALGWWHARQLLPVRDNKVARALRGEARGGERLGWAYIVTTTQRPLEMLLDQAERGSGFVTKLTTGVALKLRFLDGSSVRLHANAAPAVRLIEDLTRRLPDVALGHSGEAERAYQAKRAAANAAT